MVRNSVSIFSLIALLALSGCSMSPEMAKLFNEKVGPVLGIKLQVDAPTAKAPAPMKTTEAEATEAESPDNRAVNADFIKEIFRVVLLRDLRSLEEFNKYMNVMDQGGHYEAIYNGIIYAAEFRDREKGVASVGALKAFAQVMAQITLDQKYDPLKIQAEAADAPADTSGSLAPPQPTDKERAALVADIEREAITKSTYWMKRRLGEEILKTADLKKDYKEKLATWFARFTVFMNKRGVDFGIPQRNKTDEYFHYKWALEADEDRLKWECLNRVHKTINAGAGFREPVAVPVQSEKPAQAK